MRRFTRSRIHRERSPPTANDGGYRAVEVCVRSWYRPRREACGPNGMFATRGQRAAGSPRFAVRTIRGSLSGEVLVLRLVGERDGLVADGRDASDVPPGGGRERLPSHPAAGKAHTA